MAYFANGTEGMILDNQCGDCLLPNGTPCPILFAQITYNYDQCSNEGLKDVMNDLVNADGICQMKPILDEFKQEN